MKSKVLSVTMILFAFAVPSLFAAEGVDSPRQNPLGMTQPSVTSSKQPPLPAIYFVKGMTLKQGHAAIRSYYIKPLVTKMYSPLKQAMVPIPATMSVNMNSWILFASYGLTDKWTLGANIQVLANTIDNPPLHKTGVGIADMETMIKYGVVKSKFLNLSLALNIAYPTGSTTESVSNIALGSGSYDFSFRLLSDVRLGKTMLTAAAFYTLNGTNPATGIDNGDSMRFILAEAIPLGNRASIELVANYQHQFADQNASGVIPNSSEDFLSFALGTQYRIIKNISLQALYEYSPYALMSIQRGHTFKAGVSFML